MARKVGGKQNRPRLDPYSSVAQIEEREDHVEEAEAEDAYVSRGEPTATTMLEQGEEIVYVEIDLLESNPYQPRRKMDEAELLGLMFTIAKNGFTDILPARTHHGKKQLAAGHRRAEAVRRLLVKDITTGSDVAPLPELRASLAALLQENPTIKGLQGNRFPLVLRAYSDREMMDIAWGENSRRSPLLPPEEGDLFLKRRKADNLTQAQLARELGVEVTYIKRREAAAKDPDDIMEVWDDKPDSMRAVTYLRQLETAEQRVPLIVAYKSGELTTDQLRDAVALAKQPNPGAREHLEQSGVENIANSVSLIVAEERKEASVVPALIGNQAPEESVGLARTTIASSPATKVALVTASGEVDSLAAKADRARHARVTKLQNSLRTLTSYHRELLEAGVSASPDEIRVRSLIERILDDIKRAHGHE